MTYKDLDKLVYIVLDMAKFKLYKLDVCKL